MKLRKKITSNSLLVCLIVRSLVAVSVSLLAPQLMASGNPAPSNIYLSGFNLNSGQQQDKMDDLDKKIVPITGQQVIERIQQIIQNRTAMEDPLITPKDPKWWDSCRTKTSINDTLINIIVGPQIYHPLHVLEEEDQARGKFQRAMDSIPGRSPEPANSSELTRRKRSIISFKGAWRSAGTKEHSLLASNSIDDDQGALVFKQPFKADSYGIKKTSFSMSNSKTKHSMRFKKPTNRNYHSLPIEQTSEIQMTTKLYKTTASTPAPTMVIKTTTSSPAAGATESATRDHESLIAAEKLARAKADRLIGQAFANDIRISWHINGGLNTAKNLRRLVDSMNQTLAAEIEKRKPERALVNSILEQRHWLPALKDIRKNDPETRVISASILTNFSHYTQFFGVALEQMIFDQLTLDKKFIHEFRDIESNLLRALCDIETLVEHLNTLNGNKCELQKFMKVANLTINDPNLSQLNLVSDLGAEKRNKYNLDTLDSPLISSGAGSKHGPKQLLYAGRDRMPLSQRKLSSQVERLIRDQSIMGELEGMLHFYESTLMEIYLRNDNYLEYCS